MPYSSFKHVFTAALAAILLVGLLPQAATAMPVTAGTGVVFAPQSALTVIRYRRRVVRRAPGAAAVLGLFGAILGGAIAADRYDNYSNYTYGPSYDPGYRGGRVYAPAPIYRGRQPGFRGSRGFNAGPRGTFRGGAPHAGNPGAARGMHR